jgi:hypothetical protein
MLKIEKNNDGTIEVWLYDHASSTSIRICTHPDELASTLPRDVLRVVRELVNEMDRILPQEPIEAWTVVPDPVMGKGNMVNLFCKPKGNHSQ